MKIFNIKIFFDMFVNTTKFLLKIAGVRGRSPRKNFAFLQGIFHHFHHWKFSEKGGGPGHVKCSRDLTVWQQSGRTSVPAVIKFRLFRVSSPTFHKWYCLLRDRLWGCFFTSKFEDSRVFTILNFFEQWKMCCSNWKFLLEIYSLVSIENETRSQLVSIDFHEFQIAALITSTWKILSMNHKSSYAFQCFNLMFYLKGRSCGSDYAPNLRFVKVDRNGIIMYFIILSD